MIHIKNLHMFVDKKPLITDYSASFSTGQVVGILGPNGIGKTSFLRVLARLNHSYTGTICWGSQDIKTYSTKQLASLRTYIPATPICHWPLSTQQILQIENPLFSAQHPLLGRLGITPLLSQNFLTLSAGEKARVFLVYALLKNTQIIILDEITSHMDRTYQDLTLQILNGYAKAGSLIFLSLHQENLAIKYSNQVLLLKHQTFFSKEKMMLCEEK